MDPYPFFKEHGWTNDVSQTSHDALEDVNFVKDHSNTPTSDTPESLRDFNALVVSSLDEMDYKS